MCTAVTCVTSRLAGNSTSSQIVKKPFPNMGFSRCRGCLRLETLERNAAVTDAVTTAVQSLTVKTMGVSASHCHL